MEASKQVGGSSPTVREGVGYSSRMSEAFREPRKRRAVPDGRATAPRPDEC